MGHNWFTMETFLREVIEYINRAPPAHVALHPKKERLLGLTNKDVSKRYLQRLQKDRDRNKEVLMECVDNLPITIKQIVYPERPNQPNKNSWGSASGTLPKVQRFRLGARPSGDYWQESDEHWTHPDKENTSPLSDRGPTEKRSSYNGSEPGVREPRLGSHYSGSNNSTYSSISESGPFLHHPGFQGIPGQAPKYKYGKLQTSLSTKSSGTASITSQPATFKPKGFGALYDEMEFQRRYKKVFDLNKHIHFVHSNFLTGQRINKRTKLPPIGHYPGMQSETPDGMDIFAIMSVQKYNHPEGYEGIRAPAVTPGTNVSSPSKRSSTTNRADHEPSAFVPFISKDPFRGVKGVSPGSTPPTTHRDAKNRPSKDEEFHFRLPLHDTAMELAGQDIAALGALNEESSLMGGSFVIGASEVHSHRDVLSELKNTPRLRAATDKSKGLKQKRGKQKLSDERAEGSDNGSDLVGDDSEPFNISVHVEIKPKAQYSSQFTVDDSQVNPAIGDFPEEVKDKHVTQELNLSPLPNRSPTAGNKSPIDDEEDLATHQYASPRRNLSPMEEIRSEEEDDEEEASQHSVGSRPDIDIVRPGSDAKCSVDDTDEISVLDDARHPVASEIPQNGEQSVTQEGTDDSEDATNFLRVPSSPDGKRPTTTDSDRVKVLSRSNSSCSGQSVPEIRMTCATPVPPQMLDE